MKVERKEDGFKVDNKVGVEQEKGKTSLSKLPEEVLLAILGNLGGSSLVQVGKTCRQFRRIGCDNQLWRRMCFNDFHYRSDVNRAKDTKYAKDLYRTFQNFAKGKVIFNKKIATGLRSANFFTLHQGRVVTGNQGVDPAEDFQIRYFDEHPEGPVMSMQKVEGILYAGTVGGEVRIINLEDNLRERTLAIYADEAITSLLVNGNTLFTGTIENGVVSAWNLETGQLQGEYYSGNQKKVFSMVIHENQLFIGFASGKIEVWDLENSRLEQTLTVPDEPAVASMHIEGTHLIVGTAYSRAEVYDLERFEHQLTFFAPDEKSEDDEVQHILVAHERIFLSDDSQTAMYNLKTGAFIRSFEGTKAQIEGDKLYTIKEDGEIGIYHFAPPPKLTLRPLVVNPV